MNRYSLLFGILLLSSSLLRAEERFDLPVEPLRVSEEDGRERFLISIPNEGLERVRVFVASSEGMRVFPAEQEVGAFQAMISIPAGGAARYSVQVKRQNGPIVRSEPKMINPRDNDHHQQLAQLFDLARQIEVLLLKVQRQDQYLGRLDKLNEREKQLLVAGMVKRLSYEQTETTAQLQTLLGQFNTQFSQMKVQLDRLSQESATAKRAMELRTKLDGLRSLFDVVRNEIEGR